MTEEHSRRADSLVRGSAAFLAYLAEMGDRWPAPSLEEHLRSAGRASREAAVFCVDLTEGFCHEGALASTRVGQTVQPIVRLFRAAHSLGITNFVLPQDTHEADAEEFQSYPPHCIAGHGESETVSELRELPFASLFHVIPKNTINSGIATSLASWLDKHSDVKEFIVVGDCTDLCVYQLAMELKLRSHAHSLGCRVTVPVDCVNTYDLPVDTARRIGATPHDAELLHRVFLYHLALNGVTIVRSLA